MTKQSVVENINYDIVYDVLHNGMKDLKKFISIAKKLAA